MDNLSIEQKISRIGHYISLFAHIDKNLIRRNIMTMIGGSSRGNVFRLKNPLFPLSFCKFCFIHKITNSPDFTSFYWILADSSTKLF